MKSSREKRTVLTSSFQYVPKLTVAHVSSLLHLLQQVPLLQVCESQELLALGKCGEDLFGVDVDELFIILVLTFIALCEVRCGAESEWWWTRQDCNVQEVSSKEN